VHMQQVWKTAHQGSMLYRKEDTSISDFFHFCQAISCHKKIEPPNISTIK
jgi:hypothetical protein